MSKSDKLKNLKRVITSYHNKQGKSKDANKAILGMASEVLSPTEFIPFGIASLNLFLGNGKKPLGIPRGLVTAIGGNPQSGKSRSLLKTIEFNMLLDDEFIAIWVDAEGALDESTVYSQYSGIDPERFIVIYEGDAEDLLIATTEFLKAQVVDIVVVDSIAALCPRGELQDTSGKERTVADNTVALQARVLSQFLRMAVGSGTIKKSNAAFVFLAQVRSNIGGHGNPLAVVGGNAIKHYARLILEYRRGALDETYREKRELGPGRTYVATTGFPCIVKISKTNFGPNESSQTLVPFMYKDGFDELSASISACITSGILPKAGGWYSHPSFDGGKLQGKEKVFTFFKDNQDILKDLIENGVAETSPDDTLSDAVITEVEDVGS